MPDFECTNFFDGIPTWLWGKGNEWLHCCVDHDLGGTEFGLGLCVFEVNPWYAGIAVLMFIATTLAKPYYNYKKRKNNE